MIEIDKIKSCLQSLGNTPDEIAQSLSKYNIKGKKAHFTACPLYNYLKSHGLDNGICLCQNSIVSPTDSWNMPVACSKFIRIFDSSTKYDNLLEV